MPWDLLNAYASSVMVLISRESALEKVVKNAEKDDRINIPIPYNPRLKDYGHILKQNWNYMVKKNYELRV